MKKDIYDCDFLTDQQNIKEPIKLAFVLGRETDASGNGYNYIRKEVDLSFKVAEIILNYIVREMSYEQQNKLWKMYLTL